jgi:hypothetical protein
VPLCVRYACIPKPRRRGTTDAKTLGNLVIAEPWSHFNRNTSCTKNAQAAPLLAVGWNEGLC